MKKLLFILGFILPLALYGQNTFKYPVNANGGLRVGGADHTKIDSIKAVGTHFSVWNGSTDYFAIPDTTGLEYIDGLTSDAQDQLDAITADIDTLETDTVDIDDVALQLYQYALEPADSTADSTYNYVTHTQLDSVSNLKLNVSDSALYKDDAYMALRILKTGLKAECVYAPMSACDNSNTDLTDGEAVYQAIYLREAATITGIKFISAENGSFNQDNNNKVALYTYSSSDDTLRQVAVSANDSTKWETINNNTITFPFTAPYSASAGLYYIGLIFNAAGSPSTVPELWCIVGSAALTKWEISVYVSSQTDLASKLKLSTASKATKIRWAALY